MKTCVFFIATLLLTSSLWSQGTYSPETLEKIREVENNIQGGFILNGAKEVTILEQMARYNVNGMSIAVIHDYQIAWAKGYGWADVAEKRPMTTETLFEPGSISKTLNAVGILKLAQENKVDLYADINTYLTSWKFPYDSLSNGKKINLAQLLAHQAGLTVHGFPGHDIKGPVPTVYEVLDGKGASFTPAVRSAFEPDLRFQYSGGGTTISQVLLADVTRQAYDVWMYEQVLKPIGMVNSTYAQPPTKDQRDRCASAYREDGTPVKRKFHVYPEQAAAGLWMTPTDLCQYIIDMQRAWKGEPSKVLTPEMVKLHLSPYRNGPTAMGTFVEDHEGAVYFGHGAGNDGFCGQFFGSLEGGYGVVVFLNSENGRLLGDVINSVAKAYDWENFYREPRQVNSIDVPETVLKTYEGIYVFDDTWAAIGKKGNDFHFYTSGTYAKMHFETPNRFVNEEFQAVKTLFKDENGTIAGYTRSVGGREYPSATKVTRMDTLQLPAGLWGEIGWYYFETGQYAASLAAYNRGAARAPEDVVMQINLAHAHLYNGEYSTAIGIYKTHLKAAIRPGYTGADQLADDYRYLKDTQYDVAAFEKVFKDLKLKKPGDNG